MNLEKGGVEGWEREAHSRDEPAPSMEAIGLSLHRLSGRLDFPVSWGLRWNLSVALAEPHRHG